MRYLCIVWVIFLFFIVGLLYVLKGFLVFFMGVIEIEDRLVK